MIMEYHQNMIYINLRSELKKKLHTFIQNNNLTPVPTLSHKIRMYNIK